MQTGAIYTKLKADLSDFKKGINDAKSGINDLSKNGAKGFDNLNSAQRRVQEQINRVTRSLELAKLKQESFNDSTSAVKKLGVANQIENYKDKLSSLSLKMSELGTTTKQTAFYMQPGYMKAHVVANMIGNVLAGAVENATQKLKQFISQASSISTEYDKAMTTLEIIAPKFNVPIDKARETAKRLAKELRIGVAPAAEGLQNLLKSGLNLDQASDLMKRFTNEAKTGKSANISLQEAVTNLTFAYNTGNSALGNMSGISENFSDIQEKGLKILQKQGKFLDKTVGTLDEAGIKQAQYAGMIALTNLTLGSAQKFQGSFGDNQDRIAYATSEIQLKLGQLINTALKPFQKVLLQTIEPLSQNEKLLKTFAIALGGIAIAITALVIPALIAMVAPVWAVMTPLLPIVAIIAGIGIAVAGLYYAWNTNFLGIKDITVSFAQTIWSILKPALTSIKQSFDTIKTAIAPLIIQIWSQLQPALMAIWNVVQPFLIPVLSTLSAIIFGPVILAVGAAIGALYGFATVLNWVASNISNWKNIAVNRFNTFKSGVENVLNQAKNLLNSFVAFIKNVFNIDLYQVGQNIINGLINGIKDMGGTLKSTIKDMAKSVENGFKDALKIKSPSRVMIEAGKNIGEGADIGIRQEIPSVEKATLDLAKSVESSFKLTPQATNTTVDKSQSTFNSNVNINANNANASELFSMLKQMMAKDMQNQKLGFGRKAV